MSAAERISLHESNVTVGKQQWTEEGRMLGAGIGAGPSFAEVGLSAEPAAMSHGVTMGSQPKLVTVDKKALSPTAAAPAGARDMPPAVLVNRSTQQSSSATAVSPGQPRYSSQQPGLGTTANAGTRGKGFSQTGYRTANEVSQESETHRPAEPGKVRRVAPPDQQQAWYSTALQWFKRIALGDKDDLLQLGPPWTKWPDYSRLNNINALVLSLWPSLSEAIKNEIVLQMVPGMMDQVVKDYGAGYLTHLKLLEFELGKDPPKVQGMKVYDNVSGDNQVMMEVTAAWGSSCKVTVSAGLSLLGRALTIPLTIQNVQFRGTVRVTARPLLARMPYIGSIGISFIEPPHVDFELPVGVFGGLDIMALPGVYGAFRLGTQLAARQFAVYPKGIQIPLVPGGSNAGGPNGMLEIRLIRISGLRSEDLLGQSDPYVVFRLREGREVRSKTVDNNNNPEYNQTFRLLVDDPETQVLQLIVIDEDLVSFQKKVMGIAQVPLKQSACMAMPRTKVPVTLQLHKLMAPQHGIGGVLEIPIRVAGLPITAASSGGRWVYENVTGALGIGGSGRRHKSTKDRYTQVLDETGWLGPSEEYLEEMGLNKDQAAEATERTKAGQGGANAAATAGPVRQPQSPVQQTAYLVPSAGATGSSSISSSSPVRVVQQPVSPVRTAFAPAAAVASPQAGLRRHPSEGDMSKSWGPQAGVQSTNIHYDAVVDSNTHQRTPAAQRAGGMRRLGSQSAPLAAVYAADAPSGSTAVAGRHPISSKGAAAVVTAGQGPQQVGPGEHRQQQQGAQKQQQQQQDDATKQAVKGAQQDVAGKDAKNLEGNQVKAVPRGTCYLELTYTPFRTPDIPATGAGASPAAAGDIASAHGLDAAKPTDMGILAVTLVRAKGLSGWTGEPDPYVTLTLMENAAVPDANSSGVSRLREMEEFRSNTVYNEDSPRWNEKFDFIMIPASSVLLVTIWDQTSVMEAVASLSLSRERFKDHVMGRVKVPVFEVASAGRLHSSWTLQGAMMGEIEMILQWIPAQLVE